MYVTPLVGFKNNISEIITKIDTSAILKRLSEVICLWSEDSHQDPLKEQQRITDLNHLKQAMTYFSNKKPVLDISQKQANLYLKVILEFISLRGAHLFSEPYIHLKTAPKNFEWLELEDKIYYLQDIRITSRTHCYCSIRQQLLKYCSSKTILYWDYLIDDMGSYELIDPSLDPVRYNNQGFGYLNYQESLFLLTELKDFMRRQAYKCIENSDEGQNLALFCEALEFITSLETGVITVTE